MPAVLPPLALNHVNLPARDPKALPGATSNHCYFCWYVLTRALVEGQPGGGGQVGNWVGLRPLKKLPLV